MNVAADLVVTALALIATAIAVLPLAEARRDSAVAMKVFWLLLGLLALLAARLLAWSGNAIAAVPLLLIASWLPLLALRVAEQIVRRHAAVAVKWLMLGGGLLFTVITLIFGAAWSGRVLTALAAFQAVAIMCTVVHLLRAREVSPGERHLAQVFAAALALAIPLTATDFQGIAHLPVRGGAFAVLLLVLATSRAVSDTASLGSLIIDLLVLSGAGAVIGGSAALVLGRSDPSQLWQIGAIGAATAAVALIAQRRGEARLILRARPSLARAIAALPERPDQATLLSAHPLLASGRMVEGDMLHAYSSAEIAAWLAQRVVTRSAGDAARDLLDATAATHLLRLSTSPPRFLAVSAGALAGDDIGAELDLVARVARP
ncbi:hypothetical protein ABS767_11985 [Sphingomonas sp. ST-64]|uniref:Uncharacterized protein n=1 Tax=Sphingomonas plantiphila TaxID=3163295 RepID=A0ABW8YR12_9SPHN